eukprot:12355957-Heterocapsa_arctica.AAC.1
MAHWPDTLLEPKPEVNVMGAKTHESWGALYHSVHKASTENHLAPGRATRWDVGGFKPLSRVHANEVNQLRDKAVG